MLQCPYNMSPSASNRCCRLSSVKRCPPTKRNKSHQNPTKSLSNGFIRSRHLRFPGQNNRCNHDINCHKERTWGVRNNGYRFPPNVHGIIQFHLHRSRTVEKAIQGQSILPEDRKQEANECSNCEYPLGRQQYDMAMSASKSSILLSFNVPPSYGSEDLRRLL